ncbi:Hint domain-containing protein, partial [Pseudomonas syringae]
AMATIYDMQGNTAASAAIRAKSDLEFALNFLPANRAKTLAELGAGRKFVMDGPCCFAAGTMVSTPDGERAIDTLKVGDIVWSKPEGGGEPFAAAILATHIRTDQPIYRLKLKGKQEDGKAEDETLLVTPGHPFYVPAQHGFVPVIDLKPGDRLQSLADGASENTSSEVESLELYLPVGKTYNLTVDVGHTFYVGKLKTWVHNTGPCTLPDLKPNAGMLGANGVQTASKTIWKGAGKERIDVENPNPGQRPGQIHYQDNEGNKYLYDPASKTFPSAPKSVNKLLDNVGFQKAIIKGMEKYLGE